MQYADEAFVLETRPLGDADLIVSLRTRSNGCVRGVARSARRSRKRFGGLLEPMTHVEATWSSRAGRELHRIERLDARHSYAEMQADPALQSVCAVIAEVAQAFGPEGSSDEREFRLLSAVLAALESGGEPLLLLRYFEFWTLQLNGLLGSTRECVACCTALTPGAARSLGAEGGFLCARCARDSTHRGSRLTRQEALWIEHLQRWSPDRLPRSEGVARVGGGLERMLRGQLESFSERRFRSYRHLRAAEDRA